jgi:hypothetical protein
MIYFDNGKGGIERERENLCTNIIHGNGCSTMKIVSTIPLYNKTTGTVHLPYIFFSNAFTIFLQDSYDVAA